MLRNLDVVDSAEVCRVRGRECAVFAVGGGAAFEG